MSPDDKRARHRALVAQMRVTEGLRNSDSAKRMRKSRAKRGRGSQWRTDAAT